MDRSFTTYAGTEVIDQGKRDVTWEEVRELRDYWLEDTDWRAMKDRTISQAWKDYRTALRNLPQEHDTANDAADNWPVMPDE
jgi:hypothetical protein